MLACVQMMMTRDYIFHKPSFCKLYYADVFVRELSHSYSNRGIQFLNEMLANVGQFSIYLAVQ